MTSPWLLRYDSYAATQEGLREALCTLGNGYMATRGAAPECVADGTHYPGTYVAGIFNRLETTIEDVTVSNESVVNQPNWLVLQVRTPDGRWFIPDEATLEDHQLELDMRRGLLMRRLVWSDGDGRRTRMIQRRFVHMLQPHLAGLETTFVAENWQGELVVRSAIDGRVENTLVERYRDLSSHHHDVVDQQALDDEVVCLQVLTTQSHIRIAEAARTRVLRDGMPVDVAPEVVEEPGWIGHEVVLEIDEQRATTVEKVVSVRTGRDRATLEPGEQAVRDVRRAPGFDDLVESHVFQWSELWDRFGLEFGDDDDQTQQLLNLHVFHTLQTASPNTIDLDAGIPARGLHGEAYRGHIFWDEVFVLPYLILRLPALARSLLLYRYRRLGEARDAARRNGHIGAMYPWQSASDGRETSQQLHLNPKSGRWTPDNSHLQRHINHAIAFNVITYAQTTDDVEFLRYRGGPMLIEIARFLASITSYDRAMDRYRIRGVMGPDEFHEAYPDADEPGLDDNAYTNIMTVWLLLRTRELLDGLPETQQRDLRDEVGLTRQELGHWEAVTRKMYVPFHADGIISQFDGYGELAELDWKAYRQEYGNIQRMDRILEAEGDSPNRYQLSKQADVLMLFYLLSSDELVEIFDRLGYAWDTEQIPRTIDYYLERTSHGSTLSGVVHSWLLARRDREGSWDLFRKALSSDVADIQGGTTAEGIHLGAMAGTVDLVQRGYTGIVVRHGVLWFEPALPERVQRLAFPLHYRGHTLGVTIEYGEVRITAPPSRLAPIRVGHRGEVRALEPGDTVVFGMNGSAYQGPEHLQRRVIDLEEPDAERPHHDRV